jgi:hypothetical protein
MVQVPLVESSECEPEIDENYKDASVPEEEEVDEGDWEYDYDSEVSDAVYFVQVLEEGGEVFVSVGDTPYYGVAEGKQLTASWTDFADVTDREEHDEGYFYEEKIESETTVTFTFTRGDKGVVDGVYDLNVKSSIEYTESDEWTPSDIGLQQGQMNGVAQVYLENDDPQGTQNTAADDDCEGGECELSIETNCKDSVKMQVFYAGDHDEGMWEGVKDAERGFGGLGYGYY